MADTGNGVVDPGPYGPSGRPAWRDIDWHEHQRWVTVEGRPINVIEMGEGEPLLFIHGHSGRWTNWLENIPHFAAAGRRVIAPDLPGFGHSPMPGERPSVSVWGRLLDGLLEEMGVETAAVVGNSLGGFIGAELAIKFDTRVTHLVLVDAAGLSDRYVGVFSTSFMRRDAVLGFAQAVNLYAAIPDARAQTLGRRARLRRAILQLVAHRPDLLSGEMTLELIRGSGKEAAPFATQALGSYDFSDRVPDISCPTLVVWGAKDRLVPVTAADEYSRLIPNARKVIFPDTGHIPMVERPDAFNREVERFLAEKPAASRESQPAREAA